jgi:hypothetical protein
VAVTLLIGGAWEAFEYRYDITYSTNYFTDTLGDIAMDVVGAFAAVFYLFKKGYFHTGAPSADSHV